jgi:hypothetical protein
MDRTIEYVSEREYVIYFPKEDELVTARLCFLGAPEETFKMIDFSEMKAKPVKYRTLKKAGMLMTNPSGYSSWFTETESPFVVVGLL